MTPGDIKSKQNLAEGLEMKEAGNITFKQGDFQRAVELFTESLVSDVDLTV